MALCTAVSEFLSADPFTTQWGQSLASALDRVALSLCPLWPLHLCTDAVSHTQV